MKQSALQNQLKIVVLFESTVCICQILASPLCLLSLLPFHISSPFSSVLLHLLPPPAFWMISFSFSYPSGKILFRRSHVRDVAMKRLRFIDDYCRVKRPHCQHHSVPHLTLRNVPHPVRGHRSLSFHMLKTWDVRLIHNCGHEKFTESPHSKELCIWATLRYLKSVLWHFSFLRLRRTRREALWSFPTTVEGLFISACATVGKAGWPSCASNSVTALSWNKLWALPLFQSPAH